MQFGVADTSSYGLDDLGVELAPQGSAFITLALGRYDVRVIDCDGVIRFEDPLGTEVFDGIRLTIS